MMIEMGPYNMINCENLLRWGWKLHEEGLFKKLFVDVPNRLQILTTFIPYILQNLDIYLFVISQSEKICKWDIKYEHWVTTDYVDSTYLCLPYPYTNICRQNSGYLPFLSLSQNRYAVNEVLNLGIQGRQTT